MSLSTLDNALEPDAARLEDVAAFFVDSGKVVPGLTVDERGAARSWWWPLPAIGDRQLVAALVADDSVEAHAIAATALAGLVDAEVRRRLCAAPIALSPSRAGRRTVPQAWLHSLCSLDSSMPSSLDHAKITAFADRLDDWIATGAASSSRAHLCLRVHEPPQHEEGWESAQWTIELLVRDAEEPSLLVPITEIWEGQTLFGAEAIHEVVTQLGRMARVAPELAGLLEDAAPFEIRLDTATLLSFASERVEALAEVGVSVLLPSWWTSRSRVGLRASAKSKATGPDGVVTESGFGLEQLVSFTWEAALGDRRLTKSDLAMLRQAADAKQHLVRLRGMWVQIDPAEIATLIALAGTRGEARAAELLRAGLGLDTLGAPAGVEVTGVIASGWLGELLDDALHTTITPVGTPPGFEGSLRPYQQRGVAWLAFLGRLGLGACLADDMGLGKTAQLIATVLTDPASGPTLVISPVSVLGNWARELERFAPGLSVMVHHGTDRHRDAGEASFASRANRHDVVLTTYSLIARDIDHLADVSWGRIALDEAQQIKNPGTAQTKAVARLSSHRRVALTGTPVENRLAELWSLMHVLNPGLLGSLTSFTRRFSGPIEREQDEAATAMLRRVTGPFILRRLKSDRSIIDDLPDKIEQTERCPLTREQATLYQAVVDELLRAVVEADEMTKRGLVLAGISKLKQVCNHPAHFLRDGSMLTGRSGKLSRVEELLDEIVDVGDRVLCFTQYAEWGTLLVDHLGRRYGTPPLWLHGGTPRPRRDEMVAAFNSPDGPQIFVLSLKAGGTGLNLTAASHVIHLDRWWNPAVEDQATDRAYRIGQRRTVQVHKLVSSGTIEERIDEMITNKRSLAKRVVGAGEQWVTELTVDELREVISLRPQEADG